MDNETIGVVLIVILILVILLVLIIHIKHPKYPPQPQPPQPQMSGGCSGTRYGCCPNGILAKHNNHGSNCIFH